SASASSSGRRYGSTSDAHSTWRTANSQRAKYRSRVKSAICTLRRRRDHAAGETRAGISGRIGEIVVGGCVNDDGCSLAADHAEGSGELNARHNELEAELTGRRRHDVGQVAQVVPVLIVETVRALLGVVVSARAGERRLAFSDGVNVYAVGTDAEVRHFT